MTTAERHFIRRLIKRFQEKLKSQPSPKPGEFELGWQEAHKNFAKELDGLEQGLVNLDDLMR